MKKLLIMMLGLAFITISCNVTENAAGTYSLAQCEYKFNSVSNLNLTGTSLQDKNSSLNPLAAAGLLSIFSKSTLPLQFTLTLDVKNPNYQTALFNGMQYTIEVDDIEMTAGTVDYKMQIATGQIAQLPINVSFDLKKMMKGESANAIKNLASNFIGMGEKPSDITLRIKPTIDVGGKLLSSPMYIPISFTYGKEN